MGIVVALAGTAILASPMHASGQVGLQADADVGTNGERGDAELLQAWWDVADGIGPIGNWAEARQRLAAALHDHPRSKHADRCAALLESIERAEARAPMLPEVDASTTTETLVAALPAARVNFRVVLYPLYLYSGTDKFLWEFFEESAGEVDDPAYLLYGRGREAIPLLINALADTTATRTTATERTFFTEPLVMRVCDVAMGLIEGISLCKFHRRTTELPLISEWSDEQRLELIESVQEWWEATREMELADAVIWQMQQADTRMQTRMLDALIAAGKADVVRAYLHDRFHSGENIDIPLATRLIRAGSREPLDFIHRWVREDHAINRTMLTLITNHGESADYQLLHQIVTGTGGWDPAEGPGGASQVQQIVEYLAYSSTDATTLAIPVLVAVLERFDAELETSNPDDPQSLPRLPSYLDAVAARIQSLTGVPFGFDPESSLSRRVRAYQQILSWWRREGSGAYGFSRIKHHAAAGVR